EGDDDRNGAQCSEHVHFVGVDLCPNLQADQVGGGPNWMCRGSDMPETEIPDLLWNFQIKLRADLSPDHFAEFPVNCWPEAVVTAEDEPDQRDRAQCYCWRQVRAARPSPTTNNSIRPSERFAIASAASKRC